MTTSRLSDEELLTRLVSFESVSSNSNVDIAEFIADYVQRPGVEIQRNESPEEPKLNLVATSGTLNGDRAGLVLSGHMDVVPAVETGWESDPFAATERDDRIYGRGTADMKGFLAASMNAFLDAHDRGLVHPLTLLFTYDEELGTLGAKNFVDTYDRTSLLPARAIIGEPTELKPVRMHKGHLKMLVRFAGVGAHSGYPHLGRNAIEPAGPVISALAGLRRALEAESPPNSEYFPEVPYVALNVARINGGVALNIVPDSCVIEIGIRVLPGMSGPELFERTKRVVADSTDYDHEVELISDSPPMLASENSPFLDSVLAVAGVQSAGSASFATDAGWFQTGGIECVLLGPGSIGVAHKPNEFVPREDLRTIADALPQLIGEWCRE